MNEFMKHGGVDFTNTIVCHKAAELVNKCVVDVFIKMALKKILFHEVDVG